LEFAAPLWAAADKVRGRLGCRGMLSSQLSQRGSGITVGQT